MNSGKENIEIIKKYFFSNDSFDSRKWRNQNIPEIKLILSLVSQYSTLAEKIYAIVYGEGKCSVCGNFTKLNSFAKGWKSFCSQKCSQNSESTKEKIQESYLKNHGVKSIWEIPGYKEKISTNISNTKRLNNMNKLKANQQEEYEIKNLGQTWQWTHSCGEKWENKILRKNMTCPKCSSSKPEEEIISFIKSISPNSAIKRRDRTKLYPKELDILVNDSLAIEYNGAYWHKDSNRYQAQSKTLACSKIGIKLITILESDWRNNKEKVFNLIETALCEKIKVSARDLTVKNISKKEANSFLEAYHFNGSAACNSCLGLVNKSGELLMVATFGKHRFSKTREQELIRLCSRKDIIIRGGVSKLISAWRKNNTDALISYHDLKFGWSNKLEKINFKYVSTTPPGWRWIKGSQVLERWATQKRKIQKIIQDADLSKSEVEIMKMSGWIQEFNLGNTKWKLD